MWRKGTLYGLIIGITMGWLMAAQGPVVGEDDSAIGIVKAKIEKRYKRSNMLGESYYSILGAIN